MNIARRWFPVAFLLVMIPFHLMTMVLMEVAFTENLLLSVVLVDFSRDDPNLPGSRGRQQLPLT